MIVLDFDTITFEQADDAFNEMDVHVGNVYTRLTEDELHELYFQLGKHLTNINLAHRMNEGPYATRTD